jgi:hypothetical protein
MATIAEGIVAARAVESEQLTRRDRAILSVLVLAGAVAALVLGFLGWNLAAEEACHGRYECPF